MSIESLIKELDKVEQEHWAPVSIQKEPYIRQMPGGKDLAKLLRTLEKKTDSKLLFTRVLLSALAFHGYTTFWMSKRIMQKLFVNNGLEYPGDYAYNGWFHWMLYEQKWMKVDIQGTKNRANTVTILDPLSQPLESLFGGLLTASRRASCLNYKGNLPKMFQDLETYRPTDLEREVEVVSENKVPIGAAYSITEATEATKALYKANQPTAPKETQTKPIPEFPADRPAIKDILRSWKTTLPEKPGFDIRLSFLEDLFATVAKAGYKEQDLPHNFKNDALAPWVGQKSKEHAIKMSNEDYEKALAIFSPDIQIVSASSVKNKMKARKGSSNYEMDVDVALSMITDDDEIQRMVEEHQKLLRGEK